MNLSEKPQAPELWQAVTAQVPYVRRAVAYGVIASLLVLAPSVYMLEVYDRVVNSRNHMTLAMLTLMVLAVYAVMEMLEWARHSLAYTAGMRFEQVLSARLFDAAFVANRMRHPAGSVQALADLRQVRDFFSSPALLAMPELPSALVFLVLIFFMSPVLGWTAFAGAVVQTLLAWLSERSTQPPLAAANRAAIEANQYADGTMRSAQVIEAMGMLRDIHRRWMDRQRDFLRLQAQASDAAGVLQALAKWVQQLLSSALLGLAAWLLLGNELPGGPGMMIVASILGGRVLAPLVQLVAQWRSVVQVRMAWQRLAALLTMVPPTVASMPLPPPRGKLTVEPLLAMVPGTQNTVLRNVQFSLQPGEVLAVVGPSAAGKTTLARVLVGLWPSMAGKARLDGVDIHAWDKAELGPHIGYLPQDVELFEGTVAENIARFTEASRSQVEAAARAVGLHEYIEALPQGYDTPIGRDGAVLSGGQRQRVGLARALFGEPAFVVLDEPNSSLDEQGEAALVRAIDTARRRGTTFVVMTHRASLLAVADKVLVLRDGMQQLFGPRDEVLQALRAATQPAAPGPARAAA